MTDESTGDGAPTAEIMEIGPFSENASAGAAQYLLESDGQATLYGSLHDAMKAAEIPRLRLRSPQG